MTVDARVKSKIKLIAFDLDGVLVDGLGSWYAVHQGLDTYDPSHANATAYFDGEITFGEWAQRDVELWRGREINTIKEILYGTDFMPGMEETIKKLRRKYKLAIISGGLSILTDYVRDMFRFDYAIGNEILEEDGLVCGVNPVIDFEGKDNALRKVATMFGMETSECAAVGDHINDIPMLKIAGFRIAFNPKDPELEKFADVVIREKDLTKILPFFV